MTLNLHADEYAALTEDPNSVQDERTADRIGRLEGKNEWLLHQFEALQTKLAAGLPFNLAPRPCGGPCSRSWAGQERAVDAAVAKAREQDAAREDFISPCAQLCASLTREPMGLRAVVFIRGLSRHGRVQEGWW